MQKNIILFVSIIIAAFILGWVVKPGDAKDITSRITELEKLSNSIIGNQQQSKDQIERINIAINRTGEAIGNIAAGIDRTEKRTIRLENGIGRLEQLNKNSIETIGNILARNSESEEYAEAIGSIGEGIGRVLTTIEERNK